MELDLWLGDRLVAHANERQRGRKVTIVYDPEVAESMGDEVPLLSCSLPTPGPSQPANARAFLEGLLTVLARLRRLEAGQLLGSSAAHLELARRSHEATVRSQTHARTPR